VPFREGVFEMPERADGSPRLFGVECPSCGARYASTRAICLDCGGRELAPCLLSPTGRVSTFTVVHQTPPGAVVDPPYVIAQVMLDDGPAVTSVLTGIDPARAEVGLRVELTLIEVRRDDDGNSVVAHAFRPSGGKR
jgi:uncharacterized OB-fold protein